VPSYLVESYLPQSPDALGEASRHARRAAEDATTGGCDGICYIRTTLLKADEACFHMFAADSLEDLEAALARAGLVADRIVQADETQEADTAPVMPRHREQRSTR